MMTDVHICIVLVVVLTSRKSSIIRSHVRNVSLESLSILRFYLHITSFLSNYFVEFVFENT